MRADPEDGDGNTNHDVEEFLPTWGEVCRVAHVDVPGEDHPRVEEDQHGAGHAETGEPVATLSPDRLGLDVI